MTEQHPYASPADRSREDMNSAWTNEPTSTAEQAEGTGSIPPPPPPHQDGGSSAWTGNLAPTTAGAAQTSPIRPTSAQATPAVDTSSAGSEPSRASAPSAAGAPRTAGWSGGGADAHRPSENWFARLGKALIDVRFERSLAVESAGLVYVLWIVFVVLNWLGTLLLSALIGFQRVYGFGDSGLVAPWLPVLVLLLGWIPVVIYIVVGRIVIEFVIAGVRTATEAARCRSLLELTDRGTDLRGMPLDGMTERGMNR